MLAYREAYVRLVHRACWSGQRGLDSIEPGPKLSDETQSFLPMLPVGGILEM